MINHLGIGFNFFLKIIIVFISFFMAQRNWWFFCWYIFVFWRGIIILSWFVICVLIVFTFRWIFWSWEIFIVWTSLLIWIVVNIDIVIGFITAWCRWFYIVMISYCFKAVLVYVFWVFVLSNGSVYSFFVWVWILLLIVHFIVVILSFSWELSFWCK